MNLSSVLGAVSAVGGKLSNIRQSPMFSALTTISAFIGGILVSTGLQSSGAQVDFSTAFSNLVQGLQLIGQGTILIATALGVLIPMAVGIVNAISSTVSRQAKTVVATPQALQQIANEPKVIAAVADSPVVVSKIIATPEVAHAAPSDNVISQK